MAPPLTPRRRMRLGAWFLFLLPLLIVAGIALGEWSGWPFLRAPLETQLASHLARPVRITPPFRLHLLGRVRLQAGELWIAAPPGFDVPHLADAQGLALQLRYRDLWALRHNPGLRIADMEVGRLDAQLLRHADGRSTWEGLGGEGNGESRKESGPPPRVDRLVVGAGQVVLHDAETGANLTTRFDTEEGGAEASAVSHLATNGEYAKKPLSGELATSGLLPVAGGARGAPLPAKGWLKYGGVRADFDGSVTDLYGQRRIQGDVVISGPSLAVLGALVGAVLPTSPPFRMKATVDNDGGVWHVIVGDARIGSSQLSGHFAYDPGGPRPRLYGELRGRRLMLADLAPAFGTRSPEGVPLAPPPGHALPDRRLDIPSLKNMDAAVAVNLDFLDLGNAFAQPITPLRGRITLEEGRLALTNVSATTARGSLSGSIAVDSASEPPKWQGDLAWRGIRLEDWLKVSRSRESDAGKAPPPPYVTGQLQGHAKLTGRGHSTAELLGSLEGQGTAFVRNGSISHLVIEALGLDVAQGLGVYLTGDEDLPLQCAILDFQAHSGRFTPREAVLDTPVTLVQIEGSADLAKERLDLRLVAKPRNVSPFTLRSPLRVRGQFVDPQVSVERGPIAARLAGGLLLGTMNPLAAVIPFLDPGASSEPPCAANMS